MTEQQNSYRQIMKATSLFGGVQAIKIIIAIIQSKFIAILLGPAGMGIAGLLTSTTGLVSSLTNFGLGTCAVKDIAAANETGNNDRIVTVVTVFRRLVWFTGILGAFITIVLSPWLSQLTFGNKDYKYAFAWLSVTLILNQLASGQMVLLQGMRKLKYLAKANVIGSLAGLIISVPVYYKWGIDGIVPTVILTSLTTLILALYFGRKIQIGNAKVSSGTTILEGKGMLKMGFMISLSGLITTAAAYLVRIYISNTGSVDDVGLYTAGFAIIGTYVGLVFTAMGTDYYPRLSAIAHDNQEARSLINQQAEIAILILAPIIVIFLVFINWVVILLYSSQFIGISGMIHWAALGMFFKAASWSISFIFLAKGASSIFFWNELITNIYLLGFNILGYRLGGLDGLGISFLVSYVMYMFQVFFISRLKYSFFFEKTFVKIMTIQFLLAIACFISVKLLPIAFGYIVGIIIVMFSGIYSLVELDRRMDLKSIMHRFKEKSFEKMSYKNN